ncbi:hypothetical protein GCM10027446_33750 [Angustibacter peucedani]
MPFRTVAYDQEPETLPSVRDHGAARTAQRWRRVGVLVMVLVVAAGATGLLGVHSAQRTATGDGYTATLTYARIARSGWDVPWTVQVRHPGGFDGAITLAVDADYFDIFESQRFFPEPSGETRAGHFVYLDFDPPPGDTFVVGYDAYIAPSSQLGRDGTVTVMTDGKPRVSLRYKTFLLP